MFYFTYGFSESCALNSFRLCPAEHAANLQMGSILEEKYMAEVGTDELDRPRYLYILRMCFKLIASFKACSISYIHCTKSDYSLIRLFLSHDMLYGKVSS